jgi:hypothetical protein
MRHSEKIRQFAWVCPVFAIFVNVFRIYFRYLPTGIVRAENSLHAVA